VLLMTTWLQLSANTGPAECCLGVQKALSQLLKEAAKMGVEVDVIEQVDGPLEGGLRSVLLQLDGDASSVEQFARSWCGSMLWICESPYRKGHKRRNWFLNGSVFAPPDKVPAPGQIRYEATRASGPGGQHVNKTDSAVRATHLPTGLSVKVQSGRSQHANKKLAEQLLASKLAGLENQAAERNKSERHAQHLQAERGNAARVFVGMDFTSTNR
jgi:peptide chain release factor